ncbi:MAG TPA: hypothetical protein VJC05_03790 [Candidatus Andersenbacteria bacterium]|nr:hypothetical protein [Candidatus Andersenbacteria bacterium]
MFGWIIGIAFGVVLALIGRGLYNNWQYPKLEAALLATLGKESKMSGEELRASLRKQGFRISGPRFHYIMSCLKNAKIVDGWIQEEVIDGETVRPRWYRLR